MSLTGAVAYWKHINIPEPDMFAKIADNLFVGVGVGVLGSVLRLSFAWNDTSFAKNNSHGKVKYQARWAD